MARQCISPLYPELKWQPHRAYRLSYEKVFAFLQYKDLSSFQLFPSPSLILFTLQLFSFLLLTTGNAVCDATSEETPTPVGHR